MALLGEPRAMRIVKTWLFVFLCLTMARAAEWAHQGANWSHGADMTMTVPAGLTAEEDESGVLAVKHSTGAMYVSFIWAANQGEAEQVIGAMVGQIKKDIPDAKLSAPKSAEMGGNVLKVQDGPGTINGAPFDVTVGTYSNGQKYLCLFALMSKADLEKWSQLMNALIDSIKFS